nr:HAMP domain-containing sensor histidine kinase [Halovulum dunhuangense]
MGLALGLILGRRVLARVARAAEAGERIAAGNLDGRVPVSGSGDEFDRLATSVNAMLDRIEALMQGMRIATDSISHDVRKPLTRVRAELDLALRRETDAAGAQAAMARALGQIDAAVGILGRLLDIARAEAGMAGGEWRAVDLSRIAEDAAELYLPLAEERGIALSIDTADRSPAHGEPQLLAQAVANLIDNALKYAPAASGLVRVTAGPLPSGGAFVEVTDNGPGIPTEARDRVTERFVRLDAARGGDGSGLGLSLVRAVVHLHGGRLALGDAGPGLSARIELPR